MIVGKGSNEVSKKLFSQLSNGSIQTAQDYEELRKSSGGFSQFAEKSLNEGVVEDVVIVVTYRKSADQSRRRMFNYNINFYVKGEKTFLEWTN